MESMNSLERCLTTIRGDIPDRVSTDLHNFLVAAKLGGYKFSECFQNGEMMADAQIKAWRRFGHDMLLLENGICAEAEALGAEVIYPDDESPYCREFLLKTLKDVEKLKIPDPFKTHPLRELLRATKIVSKELGTKVFVMGRADQGPFALAAVLRGYEHLLIDVALGEKLELIHKLLSVCCQTVTRFALAQIEMGAHGTSIGEVGPQASSPKIFREISFPYIKKLISEVHKAGSFLSLHICGNATEIVKDMVDTGADILELDHKTDPVKAKQVTKGKPPILGPVDPAEVLWRGTPKLVEEKCKEAIKTIAQGGGLILGPGCALPADTPPENINTLIESAKKYGVYNRDGSLKVTR